MKEKSQKHDDWNKFHHNKLIINKLWLRLCQVHVMLEVYFIHLAVKLLRNRSKLDQKIKIRSFTQKLFSQIKRSNIITTDYRLYIDMSAYQDFV